jgi:glyoxylase-like metal-dependent hydrolase (beta-lactamase superfamily II)
LPIFAARAQPTAADITTSDLGGLTLFQSEGSNVVAMPGDEGALMIDGGLAVNADALVRAVLDATGTDRIHTLINTHWHPEQTGANELVGRTGGVIFAHENTRVYLSNAVYSSIAFEGRRAQAAEVRVARKHR